MILRATEEAIQSLLQDAIDDAVGYPGAVPVLLSDAVENKPPMPYVVIKCTDSEEQITPGSGIFKVSGDLLYRSHSRETDAEQRQTVLDAINQFAYDSTAAKLSALPDFHCHGWHPTTGQLTVENETKSYAYNMRYWVYCMARDNS